MNSQTTFIKRLAFTPGEPAGIGPDLCILLAQQALPYELVVFADPDLLAARAKMLKLPLSLQPCNLTSAPEPTSAKQLKIVPVPLRESCQAGQLNKANAPYVLNCLDQAISVCAHSQASPQEKLCHALITGPIQKSVINEAGIAFSGHTEYLAKQLNCKRVVMMLASQDLKVALATTHLPLRDVADAITQVLIIETMQILHRDLQQKFGIPQPKILVCGLNPHAGENGHLGREEIDILIPALKQLQQQGIHCSEPLPADTLFTRQHLNQADAVLAIQVGELHVGVRRQQLAARVVVDHHLSPAKRPVGARPDQAHRRPSRPWRPHHVAGCRKPLCHSHFSLSVFRPATSPS